MYNLEQMVILFWIIGLTIVIALSFYLAIRSMKDFKETPHKNIEFTNFYIKNFLILDPALINKIHNLLLKSGAICSFEKLIKGNEVAMVIYCPVSIKNELPELELVELEDYLAVPPKEGEPQTEDPKKFELNKSFAWTISTKNNDKKKLEVTTNFLKMLDLKEDQKFCWQIVCHPISKLKKDDDQSGKEMGQFQVTIRCMVLDPDPVKRVELAKKMDEEIFNSTGLTKEARQNTTQQIFNDYQKRAFIPKEVSKFILDSEEIYSLIR